MNKDYQTLFALSKKIRLLESISYLLEWDQETYMPPSGASVRSEQIGLVASLVHKERTSSAYEKTLSNLIHISSGKLRAKDLSPEMQAAVREWRRDYVRAHALPPAFVKEFAELTAQSMTIWSKARKENDFGLFLPRLEKIVALSREKAEYLGYKDHPYDALLDLFEPDATLAEISKVFTPLKKEILSLLKNIQKAPQVEDACLHGKFSAQKQLAFGNYLLTAMGYDLDKGRLDLSAHPFSMSLHPHDSRVTTRIHKTSLFDSISAVLHEGGHSLYEMGLLPEYYGSPLCEAVSLGIHESQSRFWETRIGQSKPFWKYFLPKLKTYFPKLKNTSLETFYRAVNKVHPSFIRVEADEVTYSLHVILRFELEKRLIEGSLKVADLPSAWNQEMEKTFGITPPTDREGCLQDIHWSMGAFGYFPTYALGNLYASQFFVAFEKEYPDWEKRVSKGELLFVRDWLRLKIHRHGRIYRAKDLVKEVTGSSLSAQPYLTYLKGKYAEIY